jgi:hypothetical protein
VGHDDARARRRGVEARGAEPSSLERPDENQPVLHHRTPVQDSGGVRLRKSSASCWGDYSVTTFRAYIGFYGPGAYYLGGNVGTPALCAGCTTAQGTAGASANVYDGNWHHLALVFDQAAGTLTSYVDGNVDLSKSGVIAGTVAGTNFQLGGVVGAGTPVTGTIDEFGGGEKRVRRRRFRRRCRRN